MKIRNVAGALLIALLLFVVACGQEQNDSSSSSDRSFTNAWDEAISERARLYEVLPDSTLAYVRVPNLWGMLAAPKSGSLGTGIGQFGQRRDDCRPARHAFQRSLTGGVRAGGTAANPAAGNPAFTAGGRPGW